MDEKKVVSIRLGGKEKSYKEYSKQANREASFDNGYSSLSELAASREKDEENWIHDYRQKNEKKKQKKIIDFTARQAEKRNLSLPFWDDGKRKKGPKMPPFGRRSKNTIRFSPTFFLNSIFLSIVAAIVIGGALGILLLNIFTSEDTSSISNSNKGMVNDTSNNLPLSTDQSLNQTSHIPALEIFVIQEGAYSTLAKAKEAATHLKNLNLPSLIYDDTELSFLFMGASHSRESTDLLASHFAEQGKEVYVKPFTLEDGSAKVSEDWARLFENGMTWMRESSLVSAKGLAGAAVASDGTELQNAAEQWKESLQGVQDHPTLPESIALAEEWVLKGEYITQKLKNDTMSQQLALEIQQFVLDSLIIYEKLVLSIKNENN